MAKRFSEAVNIRPVDTSTGVTQAASSLSDRLGQFSNQLAQQTAHVAQARSAERGAESGEAVQLRDEQGQLIKPEFKEKPRVIGGIEVAAFNKSLRARYLAEQDLDIRENVARIAAENPDNLLAFNDAMEGYTKALTENVEPSVRGAVTENLRDLTSDARIKVQTAGIKREQAVNDEVRAKAIETLSDEAIRFAKDGNQIGASEALIQLRETMNSFVGQPGIDQHSVETAFEQIQKNVAVQNIRAATRNAAYAPGGIKAAAHAIFNFRDDPLPGFTVNEQENIYKSLVSDLNQVVSLKNKQEDNDKEFIEKSQANASEGLYLDVIGGDIGAGEVIQALESKEISLPQAEKLIAVINNRGAGVDDYTLINNIQDMIRDGVEIGEIKQTILFNTGQRLTEQTANDLLSDANESQDSESILKTSESRRAEDFIVSSMRVTGPFGALDSGAERRLAVAKREFADRVLAGEDPFLVADGLIDVDSFARSPRPMFGDKDNLDTSLAKLNQAMKAGTVDDQTYNREFELIQKLEQQKANIEAFKAAKKEHLNDGQ